MLLAIALAMLRAQSLPIPRVHAKRPALLDLVDVGARVPEVERRRRSKSRIDSRYYKAVARVRPLAAQRRTAVSRYTLGEMCAVTSHAMWVTPSPPSQERIGPRVHESESAMVGLFVLLGRRIPARRSVHSPDGATQDSGLRLRHLKRAAPGLPLPFVHHPQLRDPVAIRCPERPGLIRGTGGAPRHRAVGCVIQQHREVPG